MIFAFLMVLFLLELGSRFQRLIHYQYVLWDYIRLINLPLIFIRFIILIIFLVILA